MYHQNRFYLSKIAILILASLLIVLFMFLGMSLERFPLLTDRQICAMTAIVCFLTIPATLRFSGQPLYSFLAIYLFASYVFTNSSFILYALDGVPSYSSVWRLRDLDAYFISTSYYIVAYLSILVGAVLASLRYTHKATVKLTNINYTIKLRILQRIAKFIFFLCIVLTVILALNGEGIALVIQGNYRDIVDARVGKGSQLTMYSLTMFYWFMPWVSLILIILAKDRKQFVRNILWYLLPTMLVNFLIGRRTEPIVLAGIAFSIAYIRGFVRGINYKQIIVALFLVISIPLVGNLRDISVDKWNWKMITFFLLGGGSEGSIQKSLLSEFGISTQSLGGTMDVVPKKEPHRLGYDYAKSVYVAIPFSAKFLPLPNGIQFSKRGEGIHPLPNSWFTYHYNYSSFNYINVSKGIHITGLGYQQIAEAYLQFGGIGILLVYLLLGYILSMWWLSFTTSKEVNIQKFILVCLLMIPIISWVRNDAGPIFRNILYGYAIVFLLPSVLKLLVVSIWSPKKN